MNHTTNDAGADPAVTEDPYSEYNVPVYRGMGMAVCVLCVLGVIGNSICAVVFHRMSKVNKGLCLLKYLSCVDSGILILMFLFLLYLLRVLPSFNFITILFSTVHMFEIYLTVLIAIQRCVAVKLHQYYNIFTADFNINMALVSLGVFSFVFNIPIWIVYWPVKNITSTNFSGSSFYKAYLGYVNLIFRGLVPMIILIACNIILITSVWKRPMMGQSPRRDRLTISVLAITSLSVVTQLTSSVFMLSLMYSLFFASTLLIFVNSCINIIVYFIVGREFRQIFLNIFRKSNDSETS